MADRQNNSGTGGRESGETLDAFTSRLSGVRSQRELTKMAAAERDGANRRPFLAAIERRQSERAKEVKAAQRRSATRPVTADADTGKRAGKPASQNSRPIAPGAFGGDDARPLAEAYMDKAGEMDLKVAFGDEKSLIRNLEPVPLTTAPLPRGGNLVTADAISVDTDGLPGRISVSHAYLLDGEKPIGRCELAAPLPLVPGERARFAPGSLMFRS